MVGTPPDGTRSGAGARAGCLAGRIERVRRRLLKWGRENFQQFEWRSESDPWLTLVAETFLQRTRAEQAERAFAVLRERYPTAADLAEGGPAAAQAFTKIVGLHWRGPLLYQTAIAVAERGGRPPEYLAGLTNLPGVGPYAAAAWLSLHRNKRAVIVDNNVARWLSRMCGLPYNPETRRKRWVTELADQLTPKRTFREYNYAVLDFTMRICRPRAPLCPDCPLRPDCAYGSGQCGDS